MRGNELGYKELITPNAPFSILFVEKFSIFIQSCLIKDLYKVDIKTIVENIEEMIRWDRWGKRQVRAS